MGEFFGRLFFGNWRRTIVTLAVSSLVLAHYFPAISEPIVAPLWSIGFALLGIWVMAWPIRKLLNPPKKRKKR